MSALTSTIVSNDDGCELLHDYVDSLLNHPLEVKISQVIMHSARQF
jgi:hypothetical protein